MKRLNLGSGRNYREGWTNLDVRSDVGADLVLDITTPFIGASLRDSFDEIDAVEVLEHVHDLPQAWTNCRDMLKEGGVMRVVVPYELSEGAWCDPTHVRAFNQRSFLYVDDWCWYLGWHRESPAFKLKREAMSYVLSDLGKAAQATSGVDEAMLLRSPRCVEQLHVTLRKVRMTATEIIDGRSAAGDGK